LKWFCAFHIITQSKNSVSSLELHRHLAVDYNTAWLLKQKIMEMMSQCEEKYHLNGRIELDDAYLGGKLSGGKRGRGSENKKPFIAAISVSPEGKPLYAKFSTLKSFNFKEVKQWAEKYMTRSSTSVTDGLPAFRILADYGTHEIHVTSHMNKDEKDRTFKWVDTILSNIKTSISGTFHALDFERHGRRYLADLQFRFNRRKDLKLMFLGLVKKAVSSPPIPANCFS
jgi:hypothetical protein